MEEQTETDPAAALRLVRDTKRAAALRARAPAWYHPALGLVFVMLVGSMETERASFFGGVALCLLAAIVVQYQKVTGVWLNGFTAGGTRAKTIMAGFVGLIIVTMLAGLWLKYREGVDGAMIGAGLLTGLIATVSGFVWERAYVRDTEEGR